MKLLLEMKVSKDEVCNLYAKLYSLNIKIRDRFKEIGSLQDAVPTARLEIMKEYVDVAFLFRQVVDLLQSLKNICETTGSMAERIVCMNAILLEDPSSIEGKLAKGSPDLKTSPKLPHPEKDPGNFKKLLQACIDNDKLECLRFHWPTVRDWSTEVLAEGGSIPGIEATKMGQDYKLRFREKKGSSK